MDDIARSASGTLDADEAAMRRSLGLDRGTLRAPAATPRSGQESGQRTAQMQPGQARARHRYRQDGEVPVEIADTGRGGARNSAGSGNGHHAELEQLRTTLHQERAAREQAEHALQQARDNLRTLQTQIAHADMTHREAIAAEQRARDAAEHALQEVRERLAAAEAERIQPQRRRQAAASHEEQADAEGPQPVQWWLPEWKERNG